MLSNKIAEDFVQRLGLYDVEFTASESDASGDIIAVFAPDTTFQTVKDAIDRYVPYRSKIVDNGLNFIEIHDNIFVDGLRTRVAYLIAEGDMGYGVVIKVMTKTVDCFINGELKSFLSFEAMKEYKNRLVVD